MRPSLHGVFWVRSDTGCLAQKLQQSISGGFSCAFLEELRSGLDHSNFFGHRHGDPLIQGNTVLLRQSLSGLLNGNREFQWIRRFTHGFTFFNKSLGRRIGTSNLLPASSKSAIL